MMVKVLLLSATLQSPPLDSEELELGGSFYVGGLDYMDPNLGRWKGG